MTVGVLKTLGTFLVFLLVQVLVLNHVHLFDSATPLLYIYMVLLFPRNYPKWGMLVWAFAMGLGVDMFSNTPGVAAASLTLVALLRPYLLELFIQRESAEDLVPSMKVLGFGRYLFFAFIIASVSSFFGYTADGGSVEVGKSSTDAVVCSSVLILFSDVFLTQLLS